MCESSSSTAVAIARSLIGAAAVTQSPDFHGNVPFLPIVFTMTQNVSVPEKTLEHWASLCVAYRYRSLAAQWWPVNGVDIDLQALPSLVRQGHTAGAEDHPRPPRLGRHKVNVDLGQLWEYSQKPLARQPFYAFPRPHWDGELAAAARADGQTRRNWQSSAARPAGGSGTGWSS